MRNHSILIAETCVLATLLLVGCSKYDQELSNRKSNLDLQGSAQKQLVERRTAELKESVDRTNTQSESSLDRERKQLDMEKAEIDAQKKSIAKHANFLRENLDQQAASCKKQIDINLDRAKEQINEEFAVHNNH